MTTFRYCNSCRKPAPNAADVYCNQCGQPLPAPVQYQPPGSWLVPCFHCGSNDFVNRFEAQNKGAGCIVLLIGLLFAPLLIGIPIIFFGAHMMGQGQRQLQCRRCGAIRPA